MEKRIIKRLEQGKLLTKAQIKWAAEKLGKYEDDCGTCLFNLCSYLGVDMRESAKIQINSYPDTFSFILKEELPAFNRDLGPCETRDRILHEQMRTLKVNSPYHAYEDYTVEVVTKTAEGEIWRLGS